MTASVTTLPVRKQAPAKTAQHRGQSRALKRRLARQAMILKAAAGVTAALLSVSLNHIARGVCIITLCDAWQGWAMAIGIEAAFSCRWRSSR